MKFNKCLLSAYSVPGTVLGAGDAIMNGNKNLALMKHMF